ncbi:hypothetical protein FDB44_17325, partial [Clostridium botulinum]|nr:hypothetical protein [Clostridium botulinum]
MKLYKCKKLKSLMLIMLIVPILTLSFPTKTYAIAGVDDAIAIVGGVIAPEVAVGLIVVGGIACGYEYLDNHKVEVGTFINDKLVPMKDNCVNFFKTFVNDKGEKFVGLTQEGLDFSHATIRDLEKSGVKAKVKKPAHSVVNYKEPFTQDGFVCNPIDLEKWHLTTHDIGYLQVGAKITLSFGNVKTKNYITRDYSVEEFGKYKITWNRVFDRSKDTNFFYPVISFQHTAGSMTCLDICPTTSMPEDYIPYITCRAKEQLGYAGWKVNNDCVVVPGQELVRHTGIEEGVKQGDTVAIPVAPDVIGGQEIYVPGSVKDWTTAKPADVVYTGLQEKSFSGSGSIEGDGSTTVDRSWVDTITGAIAGVKDAVKSNTKSLVNSIADIFSIPDTAPTLDFSPLMVATRKFPFCIPWDVWNCYKVFEGSAEPFKYHFDEIQLGGFVTGGETITVIPAFDLNFADYQQIDIAIKVFKFLELLLFVFMLLKFTRSN